MENFLLLDERLGRQGQELVQSRFLIVPGERQGCKSRSVRTGLKWLERELLLTGKEVNSFLFAF